MLTNEAFGTRKFQPELVDSLVAEAVSLVKDGLPARRGVTSEGVSGHSHDSAHVPCYDAGRAAAAGATKSSWIPATAFARALASRNT